jgi:hypothetical protein
METIYHGNLRTSASSSTRTPLLVAWSAACRCAYRVLCTKSSEIHSVLKGSGKSHTTAVLLEGILIQNPRLGTLPQPLSALVCVTSGSRYVRVLLTYRSFHFDTAAGGSAVQPCEAAYLASPHPTRGAGIVPPSVTVLVLCVRSVFPREFADGLLGPTTCMPCDMSTPDFLPSK